MRLKKRSSRSWMPSHPVSWISDSHLGPTATRKTTLDDARRDWAAIKGFQSLHVSLLMCTRCTNSLSESAMLMSYLIRATSWVVLRQLSLLTVIELEPVPLLGRLLKAISVRASAQKRHCCLVGKPGTGTPAISEVTVRPFCSENAGRDVTHKLQQWSRLRKSDRQRLSPRFHVSSSHHK